MDFFVILILIIIALFIVGQKTWAYILLGILVLLILI
jgi:hypothetical protein